MEEENKSVTNNNELDKENLNLDDEIKKNVDPIKLKLSNLLIIIIISLLALGALIFVIVSQYNKIYYLNADIKQLNQTIESYEIEKANITTSNSNGNNKNNDDNNEVINNKNETDEFSNISRHIEYTKMGNIPYDKKTPASKLDYIITYGVFPIAEYPQLQSIDYLELTEENKQKYTRSYYTYNKEGLRKKVNGVFGQEMVYDDYSLISNLANISVSKDFDLIPRDYEIIRDYSSIEKICDYIHDNLGAHYSSDVEKIDLNGDGNFVYVVQTYAKTVLEFDDDYRLSGRESDGVYQKIIYAFDLVLFDKDQNFIGTLYTLYDDFNETYTPQNIDVIYADIDNDSKMEILVEIPMWEDPGYVSIYKYENGQIIGDTNISTSVSP